MIFRGRSFSGREKHCVFLNTSNSSDRFATASSITGLDLDDDGRAIALVDWDFDGDQDIWISNRNAPRLRFMRNENKTNGNFLSIKLVGDGATVNVDAIGSKVRVRLKDGKPIVRSLLAGEGFLSQSSKWLHFGLGNSDSIEGVDVIWPHGDVESFVDFDVNKLYVISGGNASEFLPPVKSQIIEAYGEQPLARSESTRIQLAYRVPMVPAPYIDSAKGKRVTRFGDGRWTLINLWASWCQPCIEELGELQSNYLKLRKHGLDILALTVDGLGDQSGSLENAKQIVAKLGLQFPTGEATNAFVSTMQSMHDRQIPMRNALPLPSSFLVDPDGNLAVIYKGKASVVDLLNDLANTKSTSPLTDASPFTGTTIASDTVSDIHSRVETIVRFRLGRDLEQSGQLKEAVKHYRNVLDVTPDYAEAHNNLGNVLAYARSFDDAEKHLRKAVELKPRLDLAHHNLANLLLQKRDVNDALHHYRTAIELKPKHPGYRYSLGNAYLATGNHKNAITMFQRATTLNPQFVDAFNNLGIAYERNSDIAAAKNALQRALQLDPSHANARKNLRRITSYKNR